MLVKWIQIDKTIKEWKKSNQQMKLKMIKKREVNSKIKRRNKNY